MIKLPFGTFQWLVNLQVISNKKNINSYKERDLISLQFEETSSARDGALLIQICNKIFNLIQKPQYKVNTSQQDIYNNSAHKNWELVQQQMKHLNISLLQQNIQEILGGNLQLIQNIIQNLFQRFAQSQENRFGIQDNVTNTKQDIYEDQFNNSQVYMPDQLQSKQSNLLKHSQKKNSRQILKPIQPVNYSIVLDANSKLNMFSNETKFKGKRIQNLDNQFINKDYIQKKEIQNSLSLVHKDKKLADSETIFEGVLLLVSQVFNTEPLNNLPLFLNQNDLLKQLIKNGEIDHGFKRVDSFIYSLQQHSKNLIKLLDFKDMNTNLKKDFELFLQFWVDILSFSQNLKHFDSFWKNYCDLFYQLKQYKFFWLLQEFVEQNPNFYKIVFKYCSKKSVYYEQLFQLHFDYLISTSYFLSIQQCFINKNYKQFYFQMINMMFTKQEDQIKNILQQKKFYFDFLLKISTSNFYSYGLKIDHGFETHSLIPQVEFSQFFECSKLFLNLIDINRYKIQNNVIVSFIDKLLHFFGMQKTKTEKIVNESLKINLSNSSRYQLLLLIIFCHKKFNNQNFEIKIKIENFFNFILFSNEKDLQEFKPFIFDYFDQQEQESCQFIQQFFDSKFFIYIEQTSKQVLQDDHIDSVVIQIHLMFKKYQQYVQLNSTEKKLTFCNLYVQIMLKLNIYESDLYEQFLEIIKENQENFDFQVLILKLQKELIDFVYDFEMKIQQDQETFHQLFKIFQKYNSDKHHSILMNTDDKQNSIFQIVNQNSQSMLQKQGSDIPVLSTQKENLFVKALTRIFTAKNQGDDQKQENQHTSKASRKVVQILKETKKTCDILNLIRLATNCEIRKVNKTVLLLLINKRQQFKKNTITTSLNEQNKPFFIESLIQIFGDPETIHNNYDIKDKLDKHIKFMQDKKNIEDIFKQVLDTKIPAKKKYDTIEIRIKKDKNYAYKEYVKNLSKQSQMIKKQKSNKKPEKIKKVIEYNYKLLQIEKIPTYDKELLKEELEVMQNHFDINKKLYKKIFKQMCLQNYNYNSDINSNTNKDQLKQKNPKDKTQQYQWNYQIAWQFFVHIKCSNRVSIKDLRNSIKSFCPDEIIFFENFDKILFQMIYIAQKKNKLIQQDTFTKIDQLLLKYKDKSIEERVYIQDDQDTQNKQIYEEKIFSDFWRPHNRNYFAMQQIIYDIIPDKQQIPEYIQVKKFYLQKQQKQKCQFNFKFDAYQKTATKMASQKQTYQSKKQLKREQKRQDRINEIKQIVEEIKAKKQEQQEEKNRNRDNKRSKRKLKYFKLKNKNNQKNNFIKPKRKIKKKYKNIQSQYMQYKDQTQNIKSLQNNYYEQETEKIQQQILQQTLKQKNYADKVLQKISEQKKQSIQQKNLNKTRMQFFQNDQQTLQFFKYNMDYFRECFQIFVNQYYVSTQFELKKRISLKGILESFVFIGIVPNMLDSQELIRYYNLYLKKNQLNQNQITFRIYIQFLFYIIFIDQNIEKYYEKNQEKIDSFLNQKFQDCEFIDISNENLTLFNILNDFIQKEKSILKKLDSLMQENDELAQKIQANDSIPIEQIQNNLKSLIYLINSQKIQIEHQKLSDLRVLGYQIFKKYQKTSNNQNKQIEEEDEIDSQIQSEEEQ